MITLGALLAFLGFLACYNTSQKAVLTGETKAELWLQNHVSNSRILGLSLFIASLILFCMIKGIGAGTFVFFVMLMTFGSLIVILSPLKILNLKTGAILFLIALIIELLNLV